MAFWNTDGSLLMVFALTGSWWCPRRVVQEFLRSSMTTFLVAISAQRKLWDVFVSDSTGSECAMTSKSGAELALCAVLRRALR